MKKLVIGALVGGILVFLWHAISWTMLELHASEYRQAPDQDNVISLLSSKLPEDGQYLIPRANDNATREEHEKMAESMKGKPWAVVNYHKAYSSDMVSNIIRGLLVAIVAVFFVTWVLMKNQASSFGTTFVSTILIALAGYLFIPYSQHIWFETPGAMNNLIDVFVSWGLCGLWLGWWLNKK